MSKRTVRRPVEEAALSKVMRDTKPTRQAEYRKLKRAAEHGGPKEKVDFVKYLRRGGR